MANSVDPISSRLIWKYAVCIGIYFDLKGWKSRDRKFDINETQKTGLDYAVLNTVRRDYVEIMLIFISIDISGLSERTEKARVPPG